MLSIAAPANGQTVANDLVLISGVASDSGRGNSGIQSVTVNGIRTQGDTAVGANTVNWSAPVSLKAGSNTITVVAVDGAQNMTSASIVVNFNGATPSGLTMD